MNTRDRIRISGVGCCLIDLLYTNIQFDGEHMQAFLSKQPGDGGLIPGKLVFREEFEDYFGGQLDDALRLITGGRQPDGISIGGPSVVSLIHAAQVLRPDDFEVRVYGRGGSDQAGVFLRDLLSKMPVESRNFKVSNKPNAATVVLSDPDYHQGQGERIFINSIGASWDFGPEQLDDDFFNSTITAFGGTALVPRIHDCLSSLLKRAKSSGSLTIVNTVYDFRNEKKSPQRRWPLGDSDDSYANTDVLIADHEEALRLSGQKEIEGAVTFFKSMNLSAFILTRGANDVAVFSNGVCFEPCELTFLPVCNLNQFPVKDLNKGDTTGCGDNFAGGVMASVAQQLQEGAHKADLLEAARWGIVSGGFACSYLGGTYFEQASGEKAREIQTYYSMYQKQLSGE